MSSPHAKLWELYLKLYPKIPSPWEFWWRMHGRPKAPPYVDIYDLSKPQGQPFRNIYRSQE